VVNAAHHSVRLLLLRAGNLPKPYASMGNVQNIMGIMFSSTNFLGMTNLMAVMPLVGEWCMPAS
jgi:hypothetical protein